MADLDRAELMRLYDSAVAEYRFEVQLNWDRTKHFMLFNAAVIAAAAGLMKFGRPPTLAEKVLETALLLLAAANSVVGIVSVHRGHGYYRAARDQVRKLAAELGVEQQSLVTTPGLKGTKRNRVTVVRATQVLQMAIGLLAALAIVASRCR